MKQHECIYNSGVSCKNNPELEACKCCGWNPDCKANREKLKQEKLRKEQLNKKLQQEKLQEKQKQTEQIQKEKARKEEARNNELIQKKLRKEQLNKKLQQEKAQKQKTMAALEKQKKWEKVRALYDQGLNDMEISREVNTAPSNIFDWRKKNKLPRNYEKIRDWDLGMRMYRAGADNTEIATALNTTPKYVSKYLNGKGLKANVHNRIREKIDMSDAFTLYEEGLIDKAIAQKMQVSYSTVFRWRKEHGLPPNGCRGGSREPKDV